MESTIQHIARIERERDALRALNAELLAALQAGYSDLRTRLIFHAQGSFGASYDEAVRYVDTAVPVLNQMKAAIAAAEGGAE